MWEFAAGGFGGEGDGISGASRRCDGDFIRVRVFSGGLGAATAVAVLPEPSCPADTKVAPLSCSCGASILEVTAANTVVTGTVRFLAPRVTFTSSAIRSTFPLESFIPTILGCRANSATTGTGRS